ncbi:hypothetical protein [Brevundimonas sp.]|uniref:hypothetical protein n=1 Tax=Brevundimonas sp. TaxID=1871086 RepID=UPI002D7215CB|nr:hypothetical protein [Brevundimonas sp.]HYC75520.1 hypothetical protein [Brevundimonas sp.]
MRWPSVYLFAWFYSTVGLLLIFFFVGVPILGLASSVEGSLRLPALVAAGAIWLGFGLSFSRFPACPRCGHSPYLRAGGALFSSIPRSRCGKCDLNLRKFGLFDPRAKREPHV